MRKYVVFTISFILLFSLLLFSAELLSGMFLTARYVPNISDAWATTGHLSQEVSMFSSGLFILTLCIAVLSAISAYFTTGKWGHRYKE